MDAYTHLLERTRLPQPSLQRFAVTQIFEKLRTAPPNLGPDSDPGREAITRCLSAFSTPAVVDQSVSELCKLISKDSNLEFARGLLELQSALEGSEPRYVDLFVKGIGFLVRFGCRSRSSRWKFEATERHPFVKVLLCRNEVQTELIRQVSLFVVQSKQYGMNEVCDFLRPLLEFSILRIPFSDSSSVSFAWLLLSSLASLCCSLPSEAIPLFKLLTSCVRYFPSRSEEDCKNVFSLAEIIVDAHIVVLRDLVKRQLMVQEAQITGVMLIDALLSFCSDFEKPNSAKEPLVELSGRLLGAQKELDLPYLPQMLSPVLSLFVILNRLEFEHEQLCVLNLFSFLLEWRTGDGYIGAGIQHNLSETLIFILPIINFMSSTSSSVRGAAMNLLLILEKLPIKFLATASTGQSFECGSSFVSNPQIILFRLLEFIWFQDPCSASFFVRIASTNSTASHVGQMMNEPKSWTRLVEEFALLTAEKQNMSFPSTSSHESLLPGMPMMLGALTGVLLLHPMLGSAAIDTLIVVAKMEPKLGVTLLQAVLYYTNFLRDKCLGFSDLLLKLLGMLPSLVSHNAMLPLIVQTLMPMLRKNVDSVLYATAVRLLCKAWEINDRIFSTLQSVLLPEKFEEFARERSICISMAASICDICRTNPDRGVDLILSVAASIESRDPAIQAIGFQSLSHLCEADVVDFYTAWNVISKHILDYTSDAMIAQSLCSLLRWGAVDVEAYPEASENILQILWDIGNSSHPAADLAWVKARGSAFEALSHFDIEKNIQNFKVEIFNYIIAETNMDVLGALEKIEDNIIAYEHRTRRRSVKEKRISTKKIEKMLDVFPRIVFHSGKISNTQELPGASLICIPFKEKGLHHEILPKVSQEVLAQYEDASMEIAASLHLSRNILLALIALESWKPFMQQWLQAYITFLDSKASSTNLDKTSKAASDILKKLIHMAEDAIPRTAENVALAVGALCAVSRCVLAYESVLSIKHGVAGAWHQTCRDLYHILPPSVHAVKATALEFLSKWLHQSEREHRQWSAAISIGLISTSIHVTDHRQKLEHIDGLIQVACSSKSSMVKGACGVGLGFACQGLLCRTGSTSDEGASDVELNLLGKIIRLLSSMIAQLTQTSSDLLLNLCQYIPRGLEANNIDVTNELAPRSSDDPDAWGVAGIIVGLGGTLSALYRAGSLDIICNIKSLFMSWIISTSAHAEISDDCYRLLSMGACLGLPDIVYFCRKVDLMHDTELDQLIISYTQLISKLLLSRMSVSFHGSLLTVACVGAGNLLSCILGEGLYPLEAECVKELLELFRKTYSGTYPHVTHFGGMLGVVNAMGAGAGTVVNHHHLKTTLHTVNETKIQGSSKITGGLLHSSVEPYLTLLMQDIFLVAQSFDDPQLQQYAAWAVSLLRYHLQYKALRSNFDSQQSNVSMHKQPPQSVPEDSVVMKLSLWLFHFNSSEADGISCVNLVAILKCLSRAPRLPSLDWVAVIRRCMRYGAQNSLISVAEKDKIQEDCLQFLLTHADKFDTLLSYLDELYFLPKFRMLDLNLQLYLLYHLSDVLRLFSGDRLKMLFRDIVEYLTVPVSSYQSYSSDQKSLFRVSCWKGLGLCLDSEFLIDTEKYFHEVEHCMEVLFVGLPPLSSALLLGGATACLVEEWTESIKCLSKARPPWLQDLLWVDEDVHLEQKGEDFLSTVKKIQTKVHLVRLGFHPLTELGKLKVCLLNTKFEGLWDVLVDLTAALQHAEGSARRQWLLDVLEISCITKYPSTALQFLSLLSGSFCKYMPLLILDQRELLRDLPLTLSSLLSNPRWDVIAESAVSYLWTSTERVYVWVQSVDPPESSHLIEESEREIADLLVHVMLHACVALRHHLPLEKQLRLASMVSSLAVP